MKLTIDTENINEVNIKTLAKVLSEFTDWDAKQTLVDALTGDLDASDRGAILASRDYYLDEDEIVGMTWQHYNEKDIYNLITCLFDNNITDDNITFDLFKYCLERLKYTYVRANKIKDTFQEFIDTYEED